MLNHGISEIAGKSGSTEIFDSKSDRNWKTRAGMCDVNTSERCVGKVVWVDHQINVCDLVGVVGHLRVARRHGLTGFPSAEL